MERLAFGITGRDRTTMEADAVKTLDGNREALKEEGALAVVARYYGDALAKIAEEAKSFGVHRP